MDKTFNLNVTAYRGDSHKSSITESDLCDGIHNNIRTLSLFYPYSDEMEAIFEYGMFQRTNTTAFHFITKYLFTIIDSNEFRKKFNWPIYNKAAESAYRNSALEYVNKLNQKYHLKMGEIKSKIVVFPGGVEFMHILFELTQLTLRITIKRNPGYSQKTTRDEATQKLQTIQASHKKSNEYIKKVGAVSNDLKVNTQKAYQWIETVIHNTKFETANIIKYDFAGKWERALRKLAINRIKPELEKMKQFVKQCESIEERLNELFKNRVIHFNGNTLQCFVDETKKFSHHQSTENDILCRVYRDNSIDLKILHEAFTRALPFIIDVIHNNEIKSLPDIRYEKKIVEEMHNNLTTLIHDMAAFDIKMIKINPKYNLIQKKIKISKTSTMIKSMIISTPPISIDAIKRNQINVKRISLMDDNVSLRRIHNNFQLKEMKQNSPMLNNSSKENLNAFISPKHSMNGPLDLLRTIEKGNKFKKPMALTRNNRKLSDSILNESKIAIELSSTLISQNDYNNLVGSPLPSIDECESSGSNINGKRLLAEYFSDIENDAKTKLSPSGKIETAIAINSPINKNYNNLKQIPQIVINNLSNDNPSSFVLNDNDNENDIKNQNLPKLNFCNLFNDSDELLQNVSDSILTFPPD